MKGPGLHAFWPWVPGGGVMVVNDCGAEGWCVGRGPAGRVV